MNVNLDSLLMLTGGVVVGSYAQHLYQRHRTPVDIDIWMVKHIPNVLNDCEVVPINRYLTKLDYGNGFHIDLVKKGTPKTRYRYPFNKIGELQVLDIRDLAANKLNCIINRKHYYKKTDYYDFVCFCNVIPFHKIVIDANFLFGLSFDEIITTLTFFDCVEECKTPNWMDWEKVKRDIKRIITI